jgi:hypothetical protein
MQSPFQQPHNTSKCDCGTCHKVRVESSRQDEYERELRAATDRVLERLKGSGGEEEDKPPLCYRCNKTHAWQRECVDCYMARHDKRVFVRGDWLLPDIHNIRKKYWMEEEVYAQQHRAKRKRCVGANTIFTTASNVDTAMC